MVIWCRFESCILASWIISLQRCGHTHILMCCAVCTTCIKRLCAIMYIPIVMQCIALPYTVKLFCIYRHGYHSLKQTFYKRSHKSPKVTSSLGKHHIRLSNYFCHQNSHFIISSVVKVPKDTHRGWSHHTYHSDYRPGILHGTFVHCTCMGCEL